LKMGGEGHGGQTLKKRAGKKPPASEKRGVGGCTNGGKKTLFLPQVQGTRVVCPALKGVKTPETGEGSIEITNKRGHDTSNKGKNKRGNKGVKVDNSRGGMQVFCLEGGGRRGTGTRKRPGILKMLLVVCGFWGSLVGKKRSRM